MAWLTEQQKADQPDDPNNPERRFDLPIDEIGKEMTERGLLEIAQEFLDPTTDREAYTKILQSMGQERALIAQTLLRNQSNRLFAYQCQADEKEYVAALLCYFGEQSNLVSLDNDSGDRVFVTQAVGTELFHLLLGTWQNQGPSWKRARELVCQVIGNEFANLRARARETFNSAVAVDENGKDPLHASWVIVFEDNGRKLTTYPGADFQGHRTKILRSGELKVLRPTMSSTNRASEALLMGCGQYLSRAGIWAETHQCLIKGKRPKERMGELPDDTMRIFITHDRFCPQPLPIPTASCAF